MKKRFMKLLSLVLAASLAVPTLPAGMKYVYAEETQISDSVVLEDGINDAWTQENVVGTDSICAVEDGWLHLKAGSGNGNNPGTNPAMFVHPGEFNFDEAGYFSFTLKSANSSQDRFGVYLGYNTDKNGMYLGYDSGGWFWQKYQNGDGAWYSGSRVGVPTSGEETDVRLEWTADKKASLLIDGEIVFDKEDFSGIAGALSNRIAIKAGAWGSQITDVYLKDIHYTNQKEAVTYTLTGTVVDESGNALEGVTVNVSGKTAVTDANGAYTIMGLISGSYNVTASLAGFEVASAGVTITDQSCEVETLVMKAVTEVETQKLSTEEMDVFVSKTFPSVVRYEMKGDLAGKVFYGQSAELSTIRINDTDVKLGEDDVTVEFTEDKAVYTMTVKGTHIDAVITAELVAEGNTLAFNITDITNNLEDSAQGYPVQSIEIPNHSLVSVRSTQNGANLKGARMSSNTTISGDDYVELTGSTAAKSQDYMYAFVSNDELSAGLWSNSENNGSAKAASVEGGSRNTRVIAVTEQEEDYVKIGLGSTKWYYHRVETDSRYVKHMVEETDMPKAKVIITGDQNEDNQIDWQDGAIAYREIMNNPYKSEEVPELVAWRIAMNFGGQAQNPFLTTLDNVKRVAMHTDGLGQSVLLKGYGNEGHDSGHPDYADIGTRIGGADDMNTLMEKGAEYGARFGIHVNAGEMYPEADAFSEELVRRNYDGSLRYGWNWIDQGVGIDSVYDLGMGLRETRFDALKELVGDNMDFVYVDIWGNMTGGSDDSWQTRKLSKEINDNGWRMATEWGAANEYDATFQHWATDLTYGGYQMKGENSEVMRFLRNHQKDSWVGDYPAYRGAAMAPLLGGYNMMDFEGWQGRNDYDTYITNLYTHDLTTKFIQHYEIVKWVNGTEFTDYNPDGGKYTWTPEMEITLKDDAENVLVLERGSSNPIESAYRDRTMTLNGKVIATGAVSPGDRTGYEIQNGNRKGTESYLLPWFWDAQTGEAVSAEDEKLYHWNTQGGTTTWELPESWSNLENVVVYKLTDLGKSEETVVDVADGKVTLTAESEVPYVVFKGEKGNLDITWSEGMHIVDAGFNSGNFTAWNQEGDGTVEIAKSQYSNPMMKLFGEIAMSQTLTDLEPGVQYAVLVGVDNRSDSKASITISSGDKVLDENYTVRSIAKNYVKAYTHSNSSATVDGSSYFQNMYVFFTAPKNGDVTLTLAKEAGEGTAYFDDIRIVENTSKNIFKDENGEVVKFVQNFETNVQGIYPFVIGGIEGVEDNRTHLSELHEPFTQAGWDVKKMDDVLEGNWSVKTNGLCQRNALVYQTIPQNFRFEPGVLYRVSFDYQSGSNGIYGVVTGSGEYTGTVDPMKLPMAMGADAEETYTFELLGDITGQTWFGIYSTSAEPDYQGAGGSAQNFGGYKDFVLDNLVIEKIEQQCTAEDLEMLVEETEGKYNRESYKAVDWKLLQDALLEAKVALNRDNVSDEDIKNAYGKLSATIVYIDGIDTSSFDGNDISLENVIITAGAESIGEFGANGGPKELAIDGNPGTAWMTPYDNWSNWSALGIGWLDLQFPEACTIDGFRYLPAQDGCNYTPQVITDYEIQVKVLGSEEYQVVSSGVWAGDGSWKNVTFDEAIDNVTNVRLLGKAASPNNWWATAAEIRVTNKKAQEQEENQVDKSELQAAIDQASKLDKEQYSEEDWNKIEAKLQAAEEVNKNAEATAYEVKLATVNLKDAIESAKIVLKILKQPEDVAVYKNGENAVVTVEAVGNDVTYTWYYKNPGNVKFYKSGTAYMDGNTYSIPVYKWRSGQQIYCVITDANGDSVRTNTVTLQLLESNLEITKQPVNVTVAKGEEATVTVEASGTGLVYTWYYKNPGNVKFYKSGSQYVDGNTYKISMNQWRNGQQIYCVVTDANGAEVQSNTVVLLMSK